MSTFEWDIPCVCDGSVDYNIFYVYDDLVWRCATLPCLLYSGISRIWSLLCNFLIRVFKMKL